MCYTTDWPLSTVSSLSIPYHTSGGVLLGGSWALWLYKVIFQVQGHVSCAKHGFIPHCRYIKWRPETHFISAKDVHFIVSYTWGIPDWKLQIFDWHRSNSFGSEARLQEEVDIFRSPTASVAIGQKNAIAKSKACVSEEVREQRYCTSCGISGLLKDVKKKQQRSKKQKSKHHAMHDQPQKTYEHALEGSIRKLNYVELYCDTWIWMVQSSQ